MSIMISFLFLLLVSVASSQSYYPNGTDRNSNALPTFRVASVLSAPFLMLKENGDGRLTGNNRFEGFVKDMLDALAEDSLYRFRYRLQIPEGRQGVYGTKDNATGKWTGMVGMVQNNEADLIAADLTVTWNRMEILDFSRPFMTSPLTILTGKSVHRSEVFDFFAPFSLDVWLLFLLAYIVTFLVLWLVARISPYEQWPKIYPAVFTLPNSAWFVFSCFFRGSNYTPRTVSTRFLSASWWLFAVSVFVTYALSLRGFVGEWTQAAGTDRVYKDVHEMIDNPDFRFAVLEGGASYYMLSNSVSQLHKTIAARIESDGSFVNSYKEGYDLLNSEQDVSEDFGLIMEGSSADYVAARHCSLYKVGNLHTRQYALAFPRGSSFRPLFSRGLLHLHESGTLHLLRNRWWSVQEECPRQRANTLEGKCTEFGTTKDIENMMWPFIFLLIMLLLSLVLALIELFYDTKKTPGSVFGRRLNEALTGCCKKKPAQSRQIVTTRPSQTSGTVITTTVP